MSNATPAPAEALAEPRSVHTVYRWECHCRAKPTTLARLSDDGIIHVSGPRIIVVYGTARVTCPHCKRDHYIDPFDGLALARAAAEGA